MNHFLSGYKAYRKWTSIGNSTDTLFRVSIKYLWVINQS